MVSAFMTRHQSITIYTGMFSFPVFCLLFGGEGIAVIAVTPLRHIGHVNSRVALFMLSFKLHSQHVLLCSHGVKMASRL